MHNDFILVRPPSDPAKNKGLKNGAAALKKITETNSLFVTLDDKSGTHTKERSL